jgi:PRC-barrel domain
MSGGHRSHQEAVVRTYYVFQSASAPELRGFTDQADGAGLPADEGPWALVQQVHPDEEWPFPVSRAVVATGILENAFYLWGPVNRPASTKPIIESDRVEGTLVFDPHGNQIGTIKRLLIEKVSGRVVSVDVTFGGFLGLGVHHHTIPWDRLTYDREYSGYRTDMTEAQLREAPVFYGDDRAWPGRGREGRGVGDRESPHHVP